MEMMQLDEVIQQLKSASRPESLRGMKKFGINVENAYGVSIPILRKSLQKTLGRTMT